MSLPDDDIPRPSMVWVRSRLRFSETDVLALSEILGLPLLQSVKAAEVARSLSSIARQYLVTYAIAQERSSAKQTAEWCERLAKPLGELRDVLPPIAANPTEAHFALKLDPEEPGNPLAALSSSTVIDAAAIIERKARDAARYWRNLEKQDPTQNRRKPENFVLLARLVETFAQAFGAPRPARNAKPSNRVFQAAGKFVEWLAAELAAEDEPAQVYLRKPGMAARTVQHLQQFTPKAMASFWKHHSG